MLLKVNQPHLQGGDKTKDSSDLGYYDSYRGVRF